MPDDYLRQLHAADLAPPQAIEALIQSATGERVSATEKLVRGYANQVYRATTEGGRTVIARVAFDDRCFDAEATAMHQARAAGAPVPAIVAVASIATIRGPRPAMVMAAAPGRPLAELESSLSADQRAVVYADVATAMRAIHRVTLNYFGTLDECVATWVDLVDAKLAACRDAVPALRDAGFTDGEIARLLAQVASLREPERPSAVLCHGDLSTEHIFVDDDLCVSAIIDWGQASAAEPALDLAILRMFHPDVEVAWLQRGYGPDEPFDAAYQRRMTAHTTAVAIHYLNVDSAQGDAESVAAARDCLRRNLASWAHGAPRSGWAQAETGTIRGQRQRGPIRIGKPTMGDRAEEGGIRLLRAIEEEHAERREGQPLQAYAPVIPEAAAQRVGLSPEHYEAAVRWLEEQNAIEGDERAGEVGGKALYLITRRGVEMLGEDP